MAEKRVVDKLSQRGKEGASVELESTAGFEKVVVIVVMQRLLEAVRYGSFVVQQSPQVVYHFL